MTHRIALLLLLLMIGACEAPPTCVDGIRNGLETDIDCGGACGRCADRQACALAGDCQSGVCTGALCQVPSCTDAARNGRETDVDCGGACGKCADRQACALAGDCQSGVCTGALCQAPTCTDGARNGVEIDVDCGGACGKCSDGRTCGAATDCQSGVCADGTCRSSCGDGIKNGAETDVDCGGPSCGKCPGDSGCERSSDCLNAMCTSGRCEPDFLSINRDMDQPVMGCTAPISACHGGSAPVALTKYGARGTVDLAARMANHLEVRKSVNLAQPANSPFLTKVLSTRSDVSHLGGKTYFPDTNDPVYKRWLRWITIGAPF